MTFISASRVGSALAICVCLTSLLRGAETSTEPVVLKAARLYDGFSAELTEPGVVVVEGNRITAVGPAAEIPANAKILDLGDATLMPGFIDAHAHLTLQMDADFDTTIMNSLRREVAEQTLYAAQYAKTTIEAGFTTVRNVGATDSIDVGLRNGIRKGLIVGPRMLISGDALGARGGHSDETGFRHGALGDIMPGIEKGIASGPDGFRDAVRYRVKYGADLIKFSASGGVLSLADEVDTPQLTLEEMEALVDEAHRLRKRVAAHCHGDSAAKEAIIAGVDSIEHGTFLTPETLALMKEHGTYLVPTLLAGHSLKNSLDMFPPEIASKARQAIAAVDDMFKSAVEIGVPIAFGTDAGVFDHGRNAEEFALMVGRGMDPIDALKTAHANGAQLLGISAQVGTLTADKLADIIAIPGDSTVDITATERVIFVMKEGKIVKHR